MFLSSLRKLTDKSFPLKEIHRKCRKMCASALKSVRDSPGCAVTTAERWCAPMQWQCLFLESVYVCVCVCACLYLWVCVHRCICVAYLSPNGAGIIKGQALLFRVNTGLKICSSLSTIPSSAWMVPKEEHALLSTRPCLCVWPCVCCSPLTTLPFSLYIPSAHFPSLLLSYTLACLSMYLNGNVTLTLTSIFFK